MINPKISIVTPSFNQDKYLEETILSVLDQKYPNLEYIIIDGGSTDSSVEIIKKYENKLAYWISEADNGMYHGIQKGFEKSTGEIMSWINSDDLLAKDSLFTAAQIFNDFPSIDWLGGIPNIIDENGRITWVGNLPKWNKLRYLQLDYRYIQQEGIFWRKRLWEKSGSQMSLKYKLAGDLELWSRFFQYAELYYVTVFLGTFRMRKKNQKTLENLEEYNKEAIRILEQLSATKEESEFLFTKKHKSFPFSFNHNKRKPSSIDSIINKFPPPLLFDKKKEKFIICDFPYS